MRILISNDDGIYAPGIQALVNHLASQNHSIFVCAPDGERSTTGHCLTLHKPLRAKEVHLFDNPSVKQAWAVSGTPCDSVKLGLGMLLDPTEIDLVISGINRGPNLSTDVIYSGTVSSAIEGTVAGLPAIAVSLASFEDQHYHTAAHFIGHLLENRQEVLSIPPKTILNINVPPVEIEEVKGVRITKLGLHKFRDVFEKRLDLRGSLYYWQAGIIESSEEEADSDVRAIDEQFISMTPLHYDLTKFSMIAELKEWNLQPR